MTDQELKDLVASLAVAQARTELEQKETARIVRELTQSIKDTRSEVDGVGKSQGMVAEEFYANTLTLNPQIGKLKFDQVQTNVKIGKGHDEAQFDVMLINGNSVAIVEVKYRAQLKNLKQLDNQMIEFRKRMPAYDKYKLYGGIAGFSVPDDVVQSAHDKGYFVLKRTGDAFAVDTQGMKAF